MTSSTRQLTITFESDWHVGSGSGIPGFIDRQALRDEDNLPFLPAKTITGILRDAAEFVAYQLDKGNEKEPYHQAICSLFGNQPETYGGLKDSESAPSKLQIRSAQLPKEIRCILNQEKGGRKVHQRLIDALYFVQPGIALDKNTGCAKEDHLFLTEQVRSGIVLYADVCITDTLTTEEDSLLEKSVKAVRRIGGTRRRGGGRCMMELKTLQNSDNVHASRPLPKAIGEWVTLDIKVQTLSPVIVNRATLGNVVKSLDYIPGTFFLPRLLQALGSGPKFRQAVASGTIQVTNFYPVLEDSLSLPVPLTFFTPKQQSYGLVHNRLRVEPNSSKQLKGYRDEWITIGNKDEGEKQSIQCLNRRELMMQRMHNTVEDDVQRPTEAVGGVFTYEAIRKGAVYRGRIRIHSELAHCLPYGWQEKICGRATFGQSKKDDYGLAMIDIQPSSELDVEQVALVKDRYLVVYLLSDVLVRDENLAYGAHPIDLLRELERCIGADVSLRLEQTSPFGGDIASMCRARRAESWHRGWCMPRPSLVGLQGGSVFVFSVTGQWNDVHMARIQSAGIGERRAEGYGRIWFNPSWIVEDDLGKSKEASLTFASDVGANESLNEQDKYFLEIIEVEAWKDVIRRNARLRAYEKHANYLGKPKDTWKDISNSQWGALRSTVQALQDKRNKNGIPEGLDVCVQWLGYGFDDKGEINPDIDTWPKKRSEKWRKEGRECLLDLLINEKTIWNYLFPISADAPSSVLGEEKTKFLRKTLWPFAVRIAVDTVCEAIFDKQRRKSDREACENGVNQGGE